MQFWIDSKRTGEYTQEVKFDGVKCKTGVMSELLDVTLQNMHDLSLLYFEIRKIPNNIDLDFNILKMLARKMTNLRRLTIREMDDSSDTTREALRQMVGEVLDRSFCIKDLPCSHYIQLSAFTSTVSKGKF